MDDRTKPTRATSPPKPPASPDALVDRLFAKLATMYGAKWLDLWTGCPIAEVKAEWSRSLVGVDPETVRLALEHLLSAGNPFPPTQPEFVSIIRQFARRGPHRLALADHRRDPPPGGFQALRDVIKRTGIPSE